MSEINVISYSLLIFILISAVFLSGTYIGQLILKIRIAKLEKENLLLSQKRIMDLKKILEKRTFTSDSTTRLNISEKEIDIAVRNEIDEILGDIENS